MSGATSILFVCLGNICRSPTAEAVFRARARQAGLLDQLVIDSAGTGDWHVGKAPDARALAAAGQRGYDMHGLIGRQVEKDDFQRFDYLLAMDESNLAGLQSLQPSDFAGHLGLFLDFHPQATHRQVPDPYYGGAGGFELVLDLIEQASDGLIEHLRERA